MILEPQESKMLWNTIITISLILSLIFSRSLLNKYIRNMKQYPVEDRRRWITRIRNFTLMLILLGSITIWSNELQTAAVTLLAIAAALVIATKELILCIMGSLWRFTTKAYDVGDRIEVGAFRGDVFQYNMFSTKLYEIGPGKDHHQFTGRMIELPNSLLLNTPVINESRTGQYVLHVFRVPFKKSEDWKGAAKLLLGMAIEECSEYIEEAKRQFQRNSSKHVIESPNVEPRLHYSFSSPDQVDLVIRIPVPSKQKGRLEQAIIQRYIDGSKTKEPK